MTRPDNYRYFFDNYLKSAFQTEIDLRFWKHFLSESIEKYKSENPENRWISESGFSLFNIQPNGLNTWLHVSQETSSIEIKDLKGHSDNFFIWIMNLAIIRIYNSVELLLLQSIQYKYFPNLQNPNKSKKEANKLIAEIKNSLNTSGEIVETTNNKYLILFLKTKSKNYEDFLKVKINEDWQINWNEFYEFFSILRNIIAHHGMIVTQDVRNNLNSFAGDAFRHYFEQPINKKSIEILKPNSEHLFLNFVGHINDFAANSIKFLADETNFEFIGLKEA
jgi:hypothetical protein